MIIPEDNLHELAEGLTIVPCHLNIEKNYVILEYPVDKFITFCRENDVQAIFCQYDYYDKDKYIISDEILKEHTDNKDEYKFCEKWSKQYNTQFESMDFKRPGRLSMAASFGSMNIVWQEVDNWLEGYEKAEDALITYMEEHENEMVEFFSMDNDEPTLYDEFKEKLLSDSDFRYCTNKNSRGTYTQSFFRKKENKRFLKLVRNRRSGFDARYAMVELIDKIYNEYRNACYRAKIHVGEELPKVEED